MRFSAAIQHVQHIASLGLPPKQAIPAMVDSLQAVIPSVTNCFIWIGEDGTPIDVYERHPIPEAVDAFMGQTPYLEATGQPSMVKLVQARGEFGNWWQFTAFDGWDRSVMKNELFRPYNIGNNMDFPLRDRDRTVALLTICREPNSAPFRQREVDAVLGLRAHFLHAMRAPDRGIDADGVMAEGDVATAIVDRHGRVCSTGPGAMHFLHQLKDAQCRIPFICERVPPRVQSVIDRLSTLASGRVGLPATEDIRTPWCTMRVSAHLMSDGEAIILSMHRFIPNNILWLRHVAAAPLSPAERRVAYLMCSSLETHEIASAVGVTDASFREYSKRIRAKLNVGTREGVRSRLTLGFGAA